MRTFLLALLLIVTSPCFAQSDEILLKCKEFPKGTNIITINTTDTINVAFKKIAGIILDYGFTIENSDKELFFINTGYVAFSNYTFSTKLFVRLKTILTGGTEIKITGQSTNAGYSFGAYNYHRKDVPNRAFAHMLAISVRYEGGEVKASTDK